MPDSLSFVIAASTWARNGNLNLTNDRDRHHRRGRPHSSSPLTPDPHTHPCLSISPPPSTSPKKKRGTVRLQGHIFAVSTSLSQRPPQRDQLCQRLLGGRDGLPSHRLSPPPLRLLAARVGRTPRWSSPLKKKAQYVQDVAPARKWDCDAFALRCIKSNNCCSSAISWFPPRPFRGVQSAITG